METIKLNGIATKEEILTRIQEVQALLNAKEISLDAAFNRIKTISNFEIK